MDQQPSQATLDEFLGAEPVSRFAKYKTWAWIGLAVLGVLALGYWLFGDGGTVKSYATEAVTKGDLQVKVTATGNLAPTNQISVGSELSGLVEVVLVDVNDRVVRGQTLAQIDTLRLRDTIARSRAGLAQAQAGVGQAQATVRQTQANLSRLQEVYRLSGGKVPSLAELDNGRAEYARAVANLRASQAQVNSAQAQLSSDATNLAKATIRSPVTGVVLARQIEPGQTVAASFNTPTLFTIAEDLSAMELEVKVDEADVGQVQAGLAAKFSVDAFPGRSFPATIKRVNVGSNTTPSASASTSTVISYNAVLTVSNPDLILRPGMTATAEIVTSEEKGVLLAPNAALRFKPSVAKKKGNAFGVSAGPPGGGQRKAKMAQIGRGTRQTLHVVGEDGAPKAISVIAGASNGTSTIVTGDEVKPGMKVITGELASEK
jgi:HlyD family secretion protein